MRKPKSDFVLAKIAGRRFTPGDLRYIEELLTMEDYVVQPPTGLCGGMRCQALRNQHPAEFEAIHAELRPADFRKQQRERARHALAMERAAEQERRAQLCEAAKDRALWVSLGGIP